MHKTRFAGDLQTSVLRFVAIGFVLLAVGAGTGQAQQEMGRGIEDIAKAILAGDRSLTFEEEWNVLRPHIAGCTREGVERFLGPPQAFFCPHGETTFRYYGPPPKPEGWKPLALGPVQITYSQYDKVLGKVFFEDATAFPGSTSDEPRIADRSAPDAENWAVKCARVKEAMSRDEVKRILGAPQAYKRLLVEPYATGPGIPHQEVFYGPISAPGTWKPVELGPVEMKSDPRVYSCECPGHHIGLYLRPRRGIEVQSWPDAMARAGDVPIEEGWRARYDRIKIGMPKSRVEQVLGDPVQITYPPIPSRTFYGPWLSAPPFLSVVVAGTTICIYYSPDDKVTHKGYFPDLLGYEAGQLITWHPKRPLDRTIGTTPY